MSSTDRHKNTHLVACLEVENELAEGIIWDTRQQCAYWSDITGKSFYRWGFDKKLHQYPCPERLCAFGLTPEPDWFIGAFESGFAFFNPHTQQFQWLCKIEADLPYTRMNDGKVDRQGRFWAGSMIEDSTIATQELAPHQQASLYRLESTGQAKRIFTGVNIANGLSFSPDSQTLYFADSGKQTLWHSTFDAKSGTPGPRRTLFQTQGNAFPDGSCIDNQGYLWNAQWGGACVRRYSPSGQLDFTLPVDCQQPSCVSFGGPELKHLFITSAREGLSSGDTKLAKCEGAVMVYQTPFQGIAEPLCTVPKRP